MKYNISRQGCYVQSQIENIYGQEYLTAAVIIRCLLNAFSPLQMGQRVDQVDNDPVSLISRELLPT